MYQFVTQAVVQGNTLMQSCCWKNTGTLISKKGNYYLLQDISPNQVPGTDILVNPPSQEAQSEGLYFLQAARTDMSQNSQYNLL